VGSSPSKSLLSTDGRGRGAERRLEGDLDQEALVAGGSDEVHELAFIPAVRRLLRIARRSRVSLDPF
jgi:hypothetical protein